MSTPRSSIINRVGHRYGRWLVLARSSGKPKPTRWLCRCDCGKERSVLASDLQAGKSLSCGCIATERIQKLNFKGIAPYRGTPEYNAWSGAKQRCFYAKHLEYHRYGGRGITMVPEWREDFFQFLADMGPCPFGYQLDRIDNNGPYSPTNCRWTTHHEQMRNHSSNIVIEYHGHTYILKDLARALDINYSRLHAYHRRRGYSLEEAIARCLSRPSQRQTQN